MVKLSVNVNKIATLRNARGGQVPDLLEAAIKIQEFGADGITVHPRPDERHIRYQDARDLRKVVTTEYNIEGYPSPAFLDLVKECKPEQVTLVPDGPDVLTSNAGWDVVSNRDMLTEIIADLKDHGFRVSLFMDCDPVQIKAASEVGADRIELYTEGFASAIAMGDEQSVKPYAESATLAQELGMGVNAGHDLNSENLSYFVENVPHLLEVSIGHALISDALYLGLENTVQIYQRALGK
ncbi:MAG: pyridoxine 5'-phosphate synthase [Bacteroidota bacterium]